LRLGYQHITTEECLQNEYSSNVNNSINLFTNDLFDKTYNGMLKVYYETRN
jgi:hypothetical protein